MIKSLLTFNGYTDKVNDYGKDNASLEKSRLDVFDIVRNNELNKSTRVYQGHMPVDTAKDALGKDIMSLEDIVDKGTKLRSALQDGWVYTLDTETFGVTDEQLKKEIDNRIRTGHPDITPDNLSAIVKANHDAHVMTEFYMSKQYYKDGVAHKMVDGKFVPGQERIEVFRATNSKDVGVMNEMLQAARNTKGAGDLLFNLKRAAGTYGDGIYGNDMAKYPSSWNPNGDIFDTESTHGGLVNLEKHANAKYGTEAFTKQAQGLYDVFASAVNDGTNSIFETLNGEDFDWPVIFNYFDQAGVKVDGGVKKKIMAQQVDAQKLIAATGFKKTIYDDLNKRKDQLTAEAVALYKSGDMSTAMAKEAEADKITLGITNSNIAEAAQSRGVKFDVENTHVARADVNITQSGLEVYHEPLLRKIEQLKNQSQRKVGPSSSTIYTANRAVVFDKESDIYFSNTFGPDGNTYNSVGMEAGHSYKLNVLNNVEDFKIDGLDTKGKKILEMEDQYEYTDGIKRKSYLLMDSDKEIQSRILDTGNVVASSENKISKESIKITTENALRDKARVEKANWFNLNSDKGFKSFETYLGIYEDMTTGLKTTDRTEIFKALSDVKDNAKKGQLKVIAPGLFSNKKGYDNNIIQERVSNFMNLYDDLNENHDYYKFLKESVDNKIGSVAKFAEDSGIGTSNDYVLNYEHNKAKTAALYQAKHNLDDEMFNHLDEGKILERYYLENQNAVMNAGVEKTASALERMDGLTQEEALATARRSKFKENFGFDFDRKDRSVQEAILGYTAVEKDSRMLNTLDVMGDKGKYSRIRTDSVGNIEKDLNGLLNISAIKNKTLDGRNVARERYLGNMVKELRSRKIISYDSFKDVMKNENINPYQRATLLSNAIYESKIEAERIAKNINKKGSFAENVLDPKGLDYSSVNKKEADTLENYLSNMHKSVIKAPNNNTETYLGMNKSEMLRNNMSHELMENVTGGIGDLSPRISTFRPNDISKHEEIKSMLMNEFNYTENNAKLFIDGVLNNSANESFMHAKSGKEVKGGVANLIKTVGEGEDAKSYLITMPKNQQYKIEQMLLEQDRYGFDLEELKKSSMVFKMDRITEGKDGIRYVKSSNAAGKAITQNVVANADWKNKTLTYELRDTEDQVLISLKNQYEKGLKEMSLGNLERANSIVNFSKKEMNENKSRSSTVLTYEEGKGFIKKQKLNVSDAMLNKKMDLTDMVYTLDTVLEGPNNSLRGSLIDAVGETNVKGLLKNIAKFKDKPWKSNALSFEGLDVGTKLWFALNTEKIADSLMSNDSFMKENGSMESLLKTMKEHGTSLFYSKESGEAFKGIINLDPTHKFVAGAGLSGVSRPLINQVLNSKPMTVSDMIMLNERSLGKQVYDEDLKKLRKIENSSDLEKAFDIKLGRSWMTEDFKNIEELSNAQGFHQGFSAKIKYMNGKEFAERVNSMSNINGNESWVKDLMVKHKGLTTNKIKEMAEGIGNVTNIYEDSGAIDPALARIFEQRGVMTETLEDINKTYKIGSSYKGKEVLGQDGNKLYLQNKRKYYDVKVGFGYSEKAELHAYNARNSADALIASDVFKEISGGASVIMDPALAKHEAFNSMFTLYSNAITNNIKSDEDLKTVNKILRGHFGKNQSVRVEKLESGRYSLIEGVRKNGEAFNGVEALQSSIADMKTIIGGYGSAFTKDIKSIEQKNGIGYGDFSLMSDNTIEKSFELNGTRREGGAKINYRSQQAIGMFIGDDAENEVMKYRTSGADYDKSNPLQAIIDSDINQLMSDKKFVGDMKQSANIGAALMHSDLHAMDRNNILDMYNKDKDLYSQYEAIASKTRVVELDLQQAITRASSMDGKSIPEAFSMNYKGNPVNVYKIKLNNMKLENPLYKDLLENKESYGIDNVAEYAEKRGIKQKVSEIYIPAMDPNIISKDKTVLSKVQREASDLMNILYDIDRGTYGGKTLGKLKDDANQKLRSYSDTLRFELTDKDGFYKRSLNIRSENSARFKVANVAAPVVDDNGQYLNKFFKDRSTGLVNGKVEYKSIQAVNPTDIFGDNYRQSYKNIGKQLMAGEIDSTPEALALIKKHKGSKEWAKIGQDYLENVGFNSLIMRDPAMLSTSYQTARTYVSNQVTKGSTWIDAVSAKWMNADGDGDEINGYYHLLEERKGEGYFLKGESDKRAKALSRDIANRQGINKAKFDEVSSEYLESIKKAETDNVRSIAGYNKYFFGEDGLRAKDFADGGKINVDYINGKTEIANLLSRFLKGSIGQVSNPNYYLKAATAYYAGSRGYDDVGLYKLQRNIQLLTDTTEQSLIDIKSVKSLDDANAIAKIASSYRANMDKIAYLGDSTKQVQIRLTSMEEMISQAGKILRDKKGLEVVGDADVFFGASKEGILARNEMAARIIKQDRSYLSNYKKNSVEEVLMDTYKVLSNEHANKLFFDSTIRQTDLKSMHGKKLTDIEKMHRALGSIGLGSDQSGKAKIFRESNALHYIQQMPILNNKIVFLNDTIHSANIDGSRAPGVYRVKSIFTNKQGEASLKLIDLANNNKNKNQIVVSARNFNGLSEALKDFDVSDRKYHHEGYILKETKAALRKAYGKRAVESLEGAHQVFGTKIGNDSSLKKHVLGQIREQFDKNKVDDFLTDVEILKNNKLATNSELTEFRKQMNTALLRKGGKDYRTTRKDAMLNFGKIKELGVTSANFEKFDGEKFNDTIREATKVSYFYQNDLEKIKDRSRYNLDEMREHLNQSFDSILKDESYKHLDGDTVSMLKQSQMNKIMNELSNKDAHTLAIVKDVYAKNMNNPEFKKNILHLNLSSTLNGIKNPQQAMDILGKTVISYGDYAGYSIQQLGIEKASEILSKDYMTGVKQSISEDVREETEKIILHMKNLSGKNGIIEPNPGEYAKQQLTNERGDYLANIRKEMNEEIRRKGAVQKESTGKFAISSILDKAKTAWKDLSPGKQKMLGGGAIGALALGALALGMSGSNTLHADPGNYKKENRDADRVKVREPQEQQTSYNQVSNNDNVPMSDSRFYSNQNQGLSVNVSGDAPAGAGPEHASGLLEHVFGGSQASINTSFNDSRSRNSDSEVDEAMSNATQY